MAIEATSKHTILVGFQGIQEEIDIDSGGCRNYAIWMARTHEQRTAFGRHSRILRSLQGIQGKIDRYGVGHRKYDAWLAQIHAQQNALNRCRSCMAL